MRVEFAYPYKAADGSTYNPDVPVDVDDGLAASLIHNGLARAVTAEPTPAKAPKITKVPESVKKES